MNNKKLLSMAFLLSVTLSSMAQALQLKLNNVTVKKAMTELKQKSDYSFVYEKNDIEIPTDDELAPWNQEKVKEELEITKKYEGYIQIQEQATKKIAKYENKQIPKNFDYNCVSTLSAETKEKLIKVQPLTLGQANRIPGIKPSDILFLNIAIEKYKKTINNVE